MGSEVRIDGENGVDDISAGAGDAPGVGALAAQRIDAARVWAAAWNPTEHSELVAAGLPACWRGGGERRSSGEAGGVHRSATAGEGSRTASVVEIVLHSGHMVRVSAGADTDTLQRVLQALQTTC